MALLLEGNRESDPITTLLAVGGTLTFLSAIYYGFIAPQLRKINDQISKGPHESKASASKNGHGKS